MRHVTDERALRVLAEMIAENLAKAQEVETLEIHEAPRIAAGQDETLRPGMVITIEPGVYVPGKWGIRIEDTVVVTDSGYEILTPCPKDLVVV